MAEPGASHSANLSVSTPPAAATLVGAEPSRAAALALTPLDAAHRALGARMVPFAGYAMPVQYPSGILAEHRHTRSAAGLFDVSHMGQAMLRGRSDEAVARALERLVPADILGLAKGRQRYTQLLNAEGGILDDLMVARPGDDGPSSTLILVVNASRKAEDFALIAASLAGEAELIVAPDRALLALQGPLAEAVLADRGAVLPERFMDVAAVRFELGAGDVNAFVSRSGYTGEDGFEISLDAADAPRLWAELVGDERVRPVGLGARDSLRLEAGLCLYGHDIDETTSPIEAGLAWSIAKRRREEGGFPGAARVQAELASGPRRKRVGLRLEGRLPARERAELVNEAGVLVGRVTSGGFGPSVEAPVAMGYVDAAYAATGTKLGVGVRNQTLPATVSPMPFAPHRYKR